MRKLLLTTSALVPFGLGPILANPLGPQVVGGAATVQGVGSAAVTVTQSSQSAVINWNSFNIGAGEKTQFVQPNSSATVLNRVIGDQSPSQIFGTLQANGRVFVVNPNGVLVGNGAVVNTAGFVATSHDIANGDFMAGRYNFSIPGRANASVVNLGTITATNSGFAALVAPGVRNSGTITATFGKIGLAAANGFSLDLYGDKLLTLGVNDSIASSVRDVATGQTLNSLVRNDGKLTANGGRVELSAVAARRVVDSVINTSGVIEARSIGQYNGMIFLGGATKGTKPADAPMQSVKVSGVVNVAGTQGKGGVIQVTGENIQLANAKLDASGAAGGGKVLVGGDTGGGRSNGWTAAGQAKLEAWSIPTSATVTVDGSSTIDVSAKRIGNGGKAVFWSDEATSFYGTVFARGGTLSGDGGLVETSGTALNFSGAKIDTSALKGHAGTWLLDPYDLTIDAAAAATIGNNLAGANVVVQTNAASASGPGSVNPSGNGDIFVNSDISWSNANTLTLSAYRSVNVNAQVTSTGGASVVLRADNTGTGVGKAIFGGGAAGVYTSGLVSIYYNPDNNPAGSGVNATSYVGIDTDRQLYILESLHSGAGQIDAYRLVNTVSDLQNIKNNLTQSYALSKNIDASVTSTWNGGAGFIPIGYSAASTTNGIIPGGYGALVGVNATPSQFVGTLDGLGQTISNLTINNTTAFNLGLFSWVGATGALRNVGLSGSLNGGSGHQNYGLLAAWNFGTITNAYATGSLHVGDGALNAGGLVGWNWKGTISNSHAAVEVIAGNGGGNIGGLVGNQGYAVNGTTLTNSYATGSVTASTGSDHIGGLVGDNNGALVQNSYATGNVAAGNNSNGVGGLAGDSNGFWSNDLITASYATGNVFAGSNSNYVGGLVGSNIWNANISDSYARGNVTGSNAVGGLVGWNGYTGSPPVGATISTSYATGRVIGLTSTGGLAGHNIGTIADSYWDTQTTGQSTSAGGLGLSTAQFRAEIPSGFSAAVWGQSSSANNGYPHLLSWPQPSVPPGPNTTDADLAAAALLAVQQGGGLSQSVSQIITDTRNVSAIIYDTAARLLGSVLDSAAKLLMGSSQPGPGAADISTNSFSVIGAIVPPAAVLAGQVKGELILKTGSGNEITLKSFSNGNEDGSPNSPNQCTALIVQYAQLLGLEKVKNTADTGDGKDAAKNLASLSGGKFEYVNAGSSSKDQLPLIGSVVSIAGTANDPAGHVGIVQKVQSGSDGSVVVTLFDQNWPLGSAWKTVTFTNTSGVWSGKMSNTKEPSGFMEVSGWANPK